MGNLFNMDNKFFTFMGRVADLMILNFLFIICCIPIVTIGTSITALHYVTMKMARKEESYIARSFFKSFKENFKQSTIIWLVMLVLGLLLLADFRIVNLLEPSTINTVMKFALGAVTLIYAFVFLYVFPVLSKFENTIKNTVKNAFLMSVRHLPYSILMLVIIIGIPVLSLVDNRIFAYSVLAWVLLGFSLIAFVNSHFWVKIFDNYIPKEEEEENPEEKEIDGSVFQNIGNPIADDQDEDDSQDENSEDGEWFDK